MDSHKAFIVKYALDEDTELAEHFDNAEVTLNVAISQDYEGGELVFKNLSGNELIIFSRILNQQIQIFVVQFSNKTG